MQHITDGHKWEWAQSRLWAWRKGYVWGKWGISTPLHWLDLYESLKSKALPERWICKCIFYISKPEGSWEERTNKETRRTALEAWHLLRSAAKIPLSLRWGSSQQHGAVGFSWLVCPARANPWGQESLTSDVQRSEIQNAAGSGRHSQHQWLGNLCVPSCCCPRGQPSCDRLQLALQDTQILTKVTEKWEIVLCLWKPIRKHWSS